METVKLLQPLIVCKTTNYRLNKSEHEKTSESVLEPEGGGEHNGGQFSFIFVEKSKIKGLECKI